MRIRLIAGLTAAFAVTAGVGNAQLQPAKAGTDHPLVGKFNGSVLVGYSQKDYESRTFVSAGQPRVTPKPEETLVREGRSTLLVYQGPAGRSSIELFRNYQKAIKSQGLSETWACEDNSGQAPQCPSAYALARVVFSHDAAGGNCDQNPRYALYRKGDRATVAILAVECRQVASSPRVLVSVVEQAELDDEQVVVPSPQEITREFAAEGRIALYGIFFDTGKADLKPDSKPTIDNIGALLKSNPKLDLIITGHTDNVGDFNANVALSKKRADAVAAALARDHQIAPTRLTTFGAGMTSPRAPNTTEEGRAQNRRVELIPR